MSRALELLHAALDAGKTLTEISEISGYSRTTVSLYASGKYLKNPAAVEEALIRALDVHLCPHIGEPVAPEVCRRKALAPKPFGGTARLEWWSACQRCAHKPSPTPHKPEKE